jgi:predicted ribosomally synthesized peptide with nif11-like leader
VSVQSALRFIQQVRRDAALKSQVESLGPASELEPLLQIGRQAGFAFTDAELRQAFKHDWSMRWLHYGGPARPGAPGPSDSEPNG